MAEGVTARTLAVAEKLPALITSTNTAHARVLSLWGMPFSGDNLAGYVNDVELTVKENFGHAGPKVIEFILSHRRDWPLWRETYLELRRHYTKRAGGNNIAVWLSDHLAVLNTVIPFPRRPARIEAHEAHQGVP